MKRTFKGIWIPSEIWLNKDLTTNEKLFLVEIDSLDNDEGCFASNSYFAEFFDVSKGRCTQIIKSLEQKGLIKITLIRKGKQVVKRLIMVVNKLNNLPSKTKHPYLENDEDNNTCNNNTDNNVEINFPDVKPIKKKKQFKPPSKDEVLKYFNEKGYVKDQALKAFNYYDVADWKDARGNKVKNWKQKMIAVWFKPEFKKQNDEGSGSTFDINNY